MILDIQSMIIKILDLLRNLQHEI